MRKSVAIRNIMAFKLKVVACAEGESSRGAVRRYGVDEKRIRDGGSLGKNSGERPEEKVITGRRKYRFCD